MEDKTVLVVVTVEGGNIQDIGVDAPATVVVVDYDNEEESDDAEGGAYSLSFSKDSLSEWDKGEDSTLALMKSRGLLPEDHPLYPLIEEKKEPPVPSGRDGVQFARMLTLLNKGGCISQEDLRSLGREMGLTGDEVQTCFVQAEQCVAQFGPKFAVNDSVLVEEIGPEEMGSFYRANMETWKQDFLCSITESWWDTSRVADGEWMYEVVDGDEGYFQVPESYITKQD